MPADFIPRADPRFRTFAQNFARALVAEPWRYAIAPAQAAHLQQVVDEFVSCLAIARAPATATKGATINKTQARYSCEWLIRCYARLIKLNAGISDGDKLSLGIPPKKHKRSKVHCPQSWPLLSIIGATQGAHHLRYIDCVTGKRGKPHGSTGLQLFMTTTSGELGKFADARFVGVYTDNPITLRHEQAAGGLAATYYARWISERGETGPFCVPVKMRIVA